VAEYQISIVASLTTCSQPSCAHLSGNWFNLALHFSSMLWLQFRAGAKKRRGQSSQRSATTHAYLTTELEPFFLKSSMRQIGGDWQLRLPSRMNRIVGLRILFDDDQKDPFDTAIA
jgi:hypothetical protein